MRVRYFADTDTLAIDLDEKPSAETLDFSEYVQLDLDEAGNLSGVTIEHASRHVRLERLNTNLVPIVDQEPEHHQSPLWVEAVRTYRSGRRVEVGE
jgi:uncharacterized protein YuzE